MSRKDNSVEQDEIPTAISEETMRMALWGIGLGVTAALIFFLEAFFSSFSAGRLLSTSSMVPTEYFLDQYGLAVSEGGPSGLRGWNTRSPTSCLTGLPKQKQHNNSAEFFMCPSETRVVQNIEHFLEVNPRLCDPVHIMRFSERPAPFFSYRASNLFFVAGAGQASGLAASYDANLLLPEAERSEFIPPSLKNDHYLFDDPAPLVEYKECAGYGIIRISH